MAWITMHWTLFAKPGWTALTCSTPRCKLVGGGDYAALVSPNGWDITVIVETFLHSASQCIRQDPPDWEVEARQNVTITLPSSVLKARGGLATVDMWRSCTGWRYPADNDSFMIKQPPLSISSSGRVSFVANVNCYYTITTVVGISKPLLPSSTSRDPRPAFFPLPFSEDFEGATAGGEAPYFGDRE